MSVKTFVYVGIVSVVGGLIIYTPPGQILLGILTALIAVAFPSLSVGLALVVALLFAVGVGYIILWGLMKFYGNKLLHE